MGTKNKLFLYERGNGKIHESKSECEKENSKESFPICGHIRGYFFSCDYILLSLCSAEVVELIY
jgi:hypothetical protein